MPDPESQRDTNTTVSWISLILAFIALVVAILAYNQTGENLAPQIEEQAQESVPDWQTAREEAQQELAAL